MKDGRIKTGQTRQSDTALTQSIFKSIPAGILIQSANGEISFANRVAEEVFSFPADKIQNKTSSDPVWQMVLEDGTPVPGEDHPSMVTLRTGEPLRNQVRGIFAGDPAKTRWLLINTEPVFHEGDPEPAEVIISFTDITTLKQAQNSLSAEQERVNKKLRAIIEPGEDLGRLALGNIVDIPAIQSLVEHIHSLTGIGMALLDLDGTVLASVGWQKICSEYHRRHPETAINCLESDTLLSTGVAPGEFKLYKCKNQMWDIATPVIVGGRHVGNLFLGQFFFDDEEPDVEFFRRQATHYGFDESDYLDALDRVPRRSRDFINHAMSFYSELAALFSTISFANIKLARANTEKDTLVQRLQKSEERYRSYVDNAPFGVFIVNERAECLDVNLTGCEISGYTREELLTMSVADVVPESELALYEANIARALSFGRTSLQAHFLTKAGEERIWSVEAVKLSENRVLGFVADITEQNLAEEQREQLEAQVHQAQRMESVGRLAGGVAHDFNNLLTVITGFSELLLDGIGPADPMREDVDEILAAAKTAATLTEQLLAFSRQQIIAPRVIDLNQKMPPMQKMLQRLIGEDIDVVYDIADHLWTIRFDPGQMDQILVNLAVNARDAMEQGGTLTIEAQNVVLAGEAPAETGIIPDGEYVLIRAHDTGSGMDRETADRIFEPFFTTKEVGKGTGLGLSTVYGILEQNNSHIQVKSEPGRGSSFRIFIPRFEGKAEDVAKDDQMIELKGSETILLVEDQDMVRNLARRVLQQYGYKVIPARDGGEALLFSERFEGKIDLVLTDMVMPKMSGKALVELLGRTNPDLRVLYMSGYTDDAIARHGILEEGDNFLPKPFNPRQLVHRVRQALDD